MPPPLVPTGPDWQALADRNEAEQRGRRRRRLMAGGAALAAVVGVAAGTALLTGGGGGSAAPAGAAGSARAGVLGDDVSAAPSGAASPSPGSSGSAGASPSGSGSAAASASAPGSGAAKPSPSRAPVTTPTVPGRPDLIADHTGGNDLAVGPDAVVKQVPGGWVLGCRGTAGSYAQAPGRVVDPSRGFTVSAWVVNDAAAGSRAAISQGGGSASSFELGREDVGGRRSWSFRVQTGPGAADTAEVVSTAASASATGRFTLLTAAYDAGTRTITLYVDGSVAGSAKVSGVWAGSGPLELGRSRTGGAWGHAWTGVLGHVQVWDRALTAAEAGRIKGTGGAGPQAPAVADWLV
ncbi:LamG domain-containing protein [Kitasatospora sp. NPDC059571]|uniref:LamG domain-containing protein n=1 Tax=Kitasatospora sp. NPDC059571 TaxID=3346871 RepID=UPI00368A917F